MTIDPGDVISIGGAQLVVHRPAAALTADRGPGRHGSIEFRRTPYRQPLVTDRGTLTIGPIPERHEPRRMQLLSIAGPLLAGLVLFAFMHRVEFLALTLLSPVLLLATMLDERRAGRRSRRREVADVPVDARRHDSTRRPRCVRPSGRNGSPPRPIAADLVRRAEQTAIDLWPRGRHAEDFLRLRVGTGIGAMHAVDVVLAAGGEQRFRDEAAAAIDGATSIDGVPITVDLAGAGVGDPR